MSALICLLTQLRTVTSIELVHPALHRTTVHIILPMGLSRYVRTTTQTAKTLATLAGLPLLRKVTQVSIYHSPLDVLRISYVAFALTLNKAITDRMVRRGSYLLK